MAANGWYVQAAERVNNALLKHISALQMQLKAGLKQGRVGRDSTLRNLGGGKAGKEDGNRISNWEFKRKTEELKVMNGQTGR